MSSLNPHISPLSVALPDTTALHQAFMPFIEGGGLFVAMPHPLPLGTDVTLQVKLMDEPMLYTATGHVVWLTPNHAQEGRTAGIGVQFDAVSSATLLPIIQSYLTDTAISDLSTHTM